MLIGETFCGFLWKRSLGAEVVCDFCKQLNALCFVKLLASEQGLEREVARQQLRGEWGIFDCAAARRICAAVAPQPTFLSNGWVRVNPMNDSLSVAPGS